MQKFKRKEKTKKVFSVCANWVFASIKQLISLIFSFKPGRQQYKLRDVITRSNNASEIAQNQAAQFDLLLPEEAG